MVLAPKEYKRRRVTRETASLGRYRGMRPIIVSLDVVEGVLGFRLKGTRMTHNMTVEQAYVTAAGYTARRVAAERAAKRKEREPC